MPEVPKRSETKTEMALFNMAAMLVSVAAGFDLRTPQLTTNQNYRDDSRVTRRKKDSHILNRRDAYNSAVRDSLLEPEDLTPYRFSSPSGMPHNTYHGYVKHRPSIITSTPDVYNYNDQNDYNQYSSASPSLQHGGYSTSTIASTVKRNSFFDSDASTIISPSPNPDREHTSLYRQTSDSSNYDTPRTSKGPHRHSVTFEDDFKPDFTSKNYSHRHSPLNTSNQNPPPVPPHVPPIPPHDYQTRIYVNETPKRSSLHRSESTENPPPIPPRRRPGTNGEIVPDQHLTEHPERPTKLDLGPRKRPNLVRIPVNQNANKAESPFVLEDRNEEMYRQPDSDNTPYYSTRSSLSPGHTPPHITHQKTLLDIDMEGQTQDSTAPLLHQGAQQLRFRYSEFDQDLLY